MSEIVEDPFVAESVDDRVEPKKTPIEFSWREPLCVLLAVLLADATLYHGAGFAGIAAFICGMILLFFLGTKKPKCDLPVASFTALVLLVGAKLLWCGNGWTAFLGVLCVFYFAALQCGRSSGVGDMLNYLVLSLFSGRFGWVYLRGLGRSMMGFRDMKSPQAAVVLPICAVLVFGSLFILANPGLQNMLQDWGNRIGEFFTHYSNWIPVPMQIWYWFCIAWIMVGMFHPQPFGPQSSLSNLYEEILDGFRESTQEHFGGEKSDSENIETAKTEEKSPEDTRSPYYPAFRNTLLALIGLFAVYLVFEYYTNFTRNFPEKFDYSRHMHEGAAYLTLALALSTIMLCGIFRKNILRDPRIANLKKIACTWTLLNFLLAFSVYNRLSIYIDLNGLSRLRVIGLLGVSSVVLGLIMVARMFLRSRDIFWLFPRYYWCVFSMFFVGLVFPVDYYVAKHNVNRVMNGDRLPSIFLLRHPGSSEEFLASIPLLDCRDEILKEGACALFAEHYLRVQKTLPENTYRWTAFQYSRDRLLKILEERKSELEPYLNDLSKRKEAISVFRTHTDVWI